MSVSAWRTIGYAGLIAAGLWFAFAGSGVAAAQPNDTDATDSTATRPASAAGSARSDTGARRDQIRVRVGAHQVRITGTHDEPAGATGAAAPRNAGAGATVPEWQPLLSRVAIEVSTGAVVRGTLQPQFESEPGPAPAPEPDVDNAPPPVVEGRPASPGLGGGPPPSLGAPPVIEGRPGPGGSPVPAAPPAVPAPENPPAVPAPESPPVEPPVIDVAGQAAAGGGGGRGVEMSAGGTPQPIRVPVAIPAPRIGAPVVPARPVLPVTPSGGPVQRVAQPLLPAGTPRFGPGVTNPAPPAARGATPAQPVQAPAGAPVARTEFHRLGYPRYLRSARGGEVAAVALPGVAGLLLLTISGGVVGYRQASAGRMVRVSAAQRFLP